MAARPQNKDPGNASSLLGPFNFGSTVRWSGGLPPNPVPLMQKLAESPLPTGALERNALRIRNVILKTPARNLPPVNVGPKFRVSLPNPITAGRPSKNLGNIFNSVQNALDLHPSVLPSKPLPYSVMKQAVNRVPENVLMKWKDRGISLPKSPKPHDDGIDWKTKKFKTPLPDLRAIPPYRK
jgi:hypothetical protein